MTLETVTIPGKPADGIYLGSPSGTHYRFNHGGLTIWEDGSLKVQAIDAYRYQRELSIKRVPRSHSQYADRVYEVHTYRHPGIRSIVLVPEGRARRLVDSLEHLAKHYPTLLFNDADERRARHEGFVHFHETLLQGVEPSVKLLP